MSCVGHKNKGGNRILWTGIRWARRFNPLTQTLIWETGIQLFNLSNLIILV